jgi:DUF1365 family protein
MESCLYTGTVRHRRLAPVENRFRYSIFMVSLDLAELDEVFRGRWLWSARRPALAWFRRKDHLGDPAVPLDVAVRDLVEERTGRRPDGPIRILTHLRYFGYVQNPVSFHFCFDRAGRRVETVVAEITNTPWGERHCYVLPRAESRGRGPVLRFVFPKDFHVSPFMGMDQVHDWRFFVGDDRLLVHMENFEGGKKVLDATLRLRRREITGPALARTLLRHPFMTLSVVAAIYFQAFRLWRKRMPFHPHPKKSARTRAGASR